MTYYKIIIRQNGLFIYRLTVVLTDFIMESQLETILISFKQIQKLYCHEL